MFYKTEKKGLERSSYPGEIGKRIYENISLEAWKKWQSIQTMLINEHKLSSIKSEDRQFIEKTMLEYLFDGIEPKITGYKPKK